MYVYIYIYIYMCIYIYIHTHTKLCWCATCRIGYRGRSCYTGTALGRSTAQSHIHRVTTLYDNNNNNNNNDDDDDDDDYNNTNNHNDAGQRNTTSEGHDTPHSTYNTCSCSGAHAKRRVLHARAP